MIITRSTNDKIYNYFKFSIFFFIWNKCNSFPFFLFLLNVKIKIFSINTKINTIVWQKYYKLNKNFVLVQYLPLKTNFTKFLFLIEPKCNLYNFFISTQILCFKNNTNYLITYQFFQYNYINYLQIYKFLFLYFYFFINNSPKTILLNYTKLRNLTLSREIHLRDVNQNYNLLNINNLKL